MNAESRTPHDEPRLVRMLERLKGDAVVSKFVTHRECLVYRQAVDDMLNMVRGEGWVIASERAEPVLHADIAELVMRINEFGLHPDLTDADLRQNVQPILEDCRGFFLRWSREPSETKERAVITEAMVERAMVAAGRTTINFRPPFHDDERATVRAMLAATITQEPTIQTPLWVERAEKAEKRLLWLLQFVSADELTRILKKPVQTIGEAIDEIERMANG